MVMDFSNRPEERPTIMERAVDVKNAFPSPHPPRKTANNAIFGESPESVEKITTIINPVKRVLLLPNLVEKYPEMNMERDITAM